MKILQIVENLKFGGLENLVVDLSVSLRRRGHDVMILSIKEKGELAIKAEKAGVEVAFLDKKEGFSLSAIYRCYKFIRGQKFDVVHTHNPSAMIYGNISGWLNGRVLVNTRHGRTVYRKLPSFFWRLNKQIVTISEDAKNNLLIGNKIPDSKIRVIVNGVDLRLYANQNDVEYQKEVHINRIGIVARLAVEKNLKTLIEAFVYLVKSERNVELFIVGDGYERASLEKLADELRMKKFIKFLGFRSDVNKIIQSFDILVLSSLTEGISLTLLEAMAASKPIVATNVGGNPEVVIDGETGLLVPSKDPQKMADAIMRILSDPDLARRMGEAGRRRVEEKFSLEKMVSEYEAVYKEVLSGK